MPLNKNALIRYKILDQCFRNTGRRYFIDDLVEDCNAKLSEIAPDTNGVSKRQIQKDIVFMESSEGWEIDLVQEKVGRKRVYRYEDPHFSINNMPLNEVEINQLQAALEVLSQFKGMPQFEWIHELIPKLKQNIAVSEEQVPVISFDSNQYLKGIHFLGELYNAIHYKKVLQIIYHPFQMEEMTFTIHPYHLKQYNNRWFLFGYHPEKEKYDWNLALDRIVSIHEKEEEYHPNDQIDWQEYFEDIVGVTKPEGAALEEIELHFKDKTGYYVKTKPLHGSQKSEWVDENLLRVRLELIPNYELEKRILSFGENVKIIKPGSLAQRIKERIAGVRKLYEK